MICISIEMFFKVFASVIIRSDEHLKINKYILNCTQGRDECFLKIVINK